MQIFMNAKGQYLRFWRAENSGFVAGSHWAYSWENTIHEATLALFIPNHRKDVWVHKDNPTRHVVVELEASVKTTRIVTITGVQKDG
jgi:hypothetical protein